MGSPVACKATKRREQIFAVAANRTILVAAARPTVRVLQRVFGSDAKVISATRIPDALRILAGGVDLIICSLQFDESRMFEFLGAVKGNPKTHAVPFVSVRHLPSVLRPTAFKGIQFACKSYGAEFIDLSVLEAQYGTEEAQRRLRERVLALLPANKTEHGTQGGP